MFVCDDSPAPFEWGWTEKQGVAWLDRYWETRPPFDLHATDPAVVSPPWPPAQEEEPADPKAGAAGAA
jgi:hypothetical protein